MSSEPSDEAAEIPVAEGVQETNPKYSDAEVVEALVPEDFEAALLQLGWDSNHSKEPTWKEVGKDDHSKTRKDGEEVIQAASKFGRFGEIDKGSGKSWKEE